MISGIESLKMLIDAEVAQRERGNLTEHGESYLSGLERAYAICTEKDDGGQDDTQ